jgi:hypothetical protein
MSAGIENLLLLEPDLAASLDQAAIQRGIAASQPGLRSPLEFELSSAEAFALAREYQRGAAVSAAFDLDPDARTLTAFADIWWRVALSGEPSVKEH